jgi:phosphatidylserine/phosphatidylglycerophosphate/cardiolipin synthase-like enzyme
LAAAGVPIWIDDQARIAHGKTMVIDETVTLMGSMNWTRGAAANSNRGLRAENSAGYPLTTLAGMTR